VPARRKLRDFFACAFLQLDSSIAERVCFSLKASKSGRLGRVDGFEQDEWASIIMSYARKLVTA
jgi:hypothetical protein